MRNSKSIDRRLSEIECARGLGGRVRLIFANGSTRGVKIKNDERLSLFVATLDKLHAHASEPPPGVPADPGPREPEPVTEWDELIDVLGAAQSIGPGDRFLRTIHGLAVQLAEAKGKLQ